MLGSSELVLAIHSFLETQEENFQIPQGKKQGIWTSQQAYEILSALHRSDGSSNKKKKRECTEFRMKKWNQKSSSTQGELQYHSALRIQKWIDKYESFIHHHPTIKLDRQKI